MSKTANKLSRQPAAPKLTPVMQQHAAAKAAYPDAVLFFRLGDFYEMFGEDAILCSKVLNLTLTSRNKGKPDEIPMAGVPHHAAHSYIGRMLAAGYQIAICEQMADPKSVKGIVPRDVVRVLTPGLVTQDDHLQAKENNWLAALVVGHREIGIALLDISTGELRSARVADLSSVMGELARAAPREVLLLRETPSDGDAASDGAFELASGTLKSLLSQVAVRRPEPLSEEECRGALGHLAKDAELLSGIEQLTVAHLLQFARHCTPGADLPVRAIGRWDPSDDMAIDPSAQRHLELVESTGPDRGATLLGVLDQTCTAAGARLLRRRLLAPLAVVAPIRRRLDQVEALLAHAALRDELRRILKGVSDMERLISRVVLGEASPKDLGALRDSLLASASAVRAVGQVGEPALRDALNLEEPPDTVDELAQQLSAALVERPPTMAKEGAIFRDGYDRELSEHEEVKQRGSELIVALEGRLRESTGISTLKVKFTRVFGWYVEVSRSGLPKVPKDWRRKQTVASGERFTLEELDELADRIAGAEEQHRQRELELLKELATQARRAAQRVRMLSARMATWDVAAALAEVAHRHDYARPDVDDSSVLQIEDGRHPVVEQLAAAGHFVPNDVLLDAEETRLWVITGPNMAGKSTFLRQVALCCVMAQMGSFVPARSARIGVVDRVLSRVGANDNLAQGESTFMVEMRETAEILRSATPSSLVILDEIGRGTSTFDGLAIAWAVAEHLDQVSRCRALFATHYHELTEFAEASEHADNFSVSARERGGEIVFLHRLVHGAASRSYGVAVAQLAGLPENVLVRARVLLAALEGDSVVEAAPALRGKARQKFSPGQLGLFSSSAPDRQVPNAQHQEILDTLRAVNVDRLSPLESLQLLVKLKRRL